MMAKSNRMTNRELAASIQWKAALWEKDSIEPAMLRYHFENQQLNTERLNENREDVRCSKMVFESNDVSYTYVCFSDVLRVAVSQ